MSAQALGYTGRITFGVLLTFAATLAWRTAVDIDLGLHLAGGRYLFENGAVPRTDPFTWTVSENAYVAYHWLFQAVLAGVNRVFGVSGMGALRVVAILWSVVAIADVMRTRGVSSVSAALFGLLGLLAVEWRFSLRPELMSWALAATLLAVLERNRVGRAAPLWALPLIQCLWANSHIHVFGLALIGVYGLCAAAKTRSWRVPLLGWGLIAAAATLLNPYGIEGALYPLVLLTRLSASNVFAESIIELASPFSLVADPDHPFTTSTALFAYWVLLFCAVLAFARQLWHRHFEDAALLLVFGLLSTLAIRNLPLFVVVCLPALCSALDAVVGFAERDGRPDLSRFGPWVRRVAIAGSCVGIYGVTFGNFYAEEGRPQRFGSGWCSTCLALETADFVADSNLSGNGLNNLAMGSVLVWRDPERKVFIDGRNEVTGEDFFREYQRALEPARWPATQRDYSLEYVVFAHQGDGRAAEMMAVLAKDPGWKLIHLDGAGFVFVRVEGPNGSMAEHSLPKAVSIAERADALRDLHVKAGMAARLKRFFSRTRAPLGDAHGEGNVLARAGFAAASERPLLLAVQEHPDDFQPFLDLGLVYRTLGLRREALQALAHALALAPDHPGLAPLRAARDAR